MRNLIATLLVIIAVVPAAFAQFEDERAIRSSVSINQSPSRGRGSISGSPYDVVVIRGSAGEFLSIGTLWEYATGEYLWAFPQVGPNPVINWEFNSGGRMTLRCDYSRISNPVIVGGTVELWTWFGDWFFIDRDRLF